MRERFDSIYSHGIIRAAVCIPSLRVADPAFNLERTLALARQASKAKVAVALFPELGLSAYSNDDLVPPGRAAGREQGRGRRGWSRRAQG